MFTSNKTMEGCDMDFSDIRTIIIGEAGEYILQDMLIPKEEVQVLHSHSLKSEK